MTDAPDDLSNAVQLHSCQTLTPETDASTHYFFQQAHDSSLLDSTVTDSIYNSVMQAFEEDRAMITAQYRTIQIDPDAPMLAMGMDGAPRHRTIDELVR